MKALEVRIRKVARKDIERIIDIERSWHHLSHWSADSYYRLINEDSFTSSYVAEIDDESGLPKIVGFVLFTSPPKSPRSTTLLSKPRMPGRHRQTADVRRH